MPSLKQTISLNNQLLTKSYLESLSYEQREVLIEQLFNHMREVGWIYPDDNDLKECKKSWKRLVDFVPDLTKTELFNNSDLATDICRYFCHTKFYETREVKRSNNFEVFNDDIKLKAIIKNRLGMDWLLPDAGGNGVNECFNLTYKQILLTGPRSKGYVNPTSIFKCDVAKYLTQKYCPIGGTIFDYSMGWGARMLGVACFNEKEIQYNYIGTDPNTCDDLNNMIKVMELKGCKSYNLGSENIVLDNDSIDFSYSSPPYYDKEIYSSNNTQAASKGEEHFYEVYWRQTLKNVKAALKPGCWFGLNIKDQDRMLNIAKDIFGEVDHEISLRTVRSHLTKTSGNQKYEPIYLFKNIK